MKRNFSEQRREDLGYRLAVERKRLGIGQEEMAERLGVSLSTYRRAEQGKPDISGAGLAGIMEAAGLGRFLESGDANASLQYWIRTLNAVKGYMLSHYCGAETAMKEMCIPPEDRELLLHLIREDAE